MPRAGLRIFFTVLALIVFLTSLVFAFLSSAPISFSNTGNSTRTLVPGLFTQSVEGLDAKYPSDIAPADWVFIVIWPLVYFWNLIGIIYLVVSLCLPSDKSPIMGEPIMIPITSLIFWSLLWGLSFSWLFIYDREYVTLGLFFIIGAAWSGYLFLGFSYRCYRKDIFYLERHSSKMLWIVRILIHNGFAIVTTWLTCAWKINFATVITYAESRGIDTIPAAQRGSLTAEDAGTIALALLLLEFVIWFVLENFVFEGLCRYTVTIYPTLIFVFVGILVGNPQRSGDDTTFFRQNRIIALAGLILAVIAFVVRIMLVVIRHRRRITLA